MKNIYEKYKNKLFRYWVYLNENREVLISKLTIKITSVLAFSVNAVIYIATEYFLITFIIGLINGKSALYTILSPDELSKCFYSFRGFIVILHFIIVIQAVVLHYRAKNEWNLKYYLNLFFRSLPLITISFFTYVK